MAVKHAPNLTSDVLDKLSRRSIMVITLLGITVIGIVDYLIGPGISLSILYLGPTGLAAWYLGKEAGMAAALISALVGRATDLMTGVVLIHPWLTAWNVFLHLGFMLVIVLLLTYQKAYLRIEQELAKTDSLTGVFNHGEFMERLQYIFNIAAREQWSVTLAYIDIDDFKHINDQKGHAEGDRVLCTVAAQLAASVRHTDIVARMGGDEFAVVLPHADRIAVESFVQKLLRALSAVPVGESKVTCSIGCLTFPPPPPNAECALKEADVLMYQVKKRGKGEVGFAEYKPQPIRA
jgi:diguanylate cyclase (GGDEF)-like protein